MSDRLDRLRLIRSENVGPVTFRELLRHFGSAAAALDALPSLAARGGRRRIKVCAKSVATEEMECLERLGGRHVFLGEAEYPEALAALEEAPPALLVMGNIHLLQSRAVAIVGARNASTNGRRIARDIAAGVAEAGLLVASGMARGIDAAAHGGALEGGTVAVLAGGPDNVYPKENQALYDDICERGVIITEMPPGLEPQARHFPRRNRIISGLALAVVVVEAALRSGSLITARLANEQGREVLAVPGSPLDPRCRGANGLIRAGATLVESAEDVLLAVRAMRGDFISEPDKAAFDGADAEPADDIPATLRARVIEALGPTPAPVDEIIRDLGIAPQKVLTVLLELELAGRLERHPGNMAALVPEGA
ncbi:MAG: DNA-processing protein DprA [Alphaproteobacteria bacterium]